jgi:hypothetical protein
MAGLRFPGFRLSAGYYVHGYGASITFNRCKKTGDRVGLFPSVLPLLQLVPQGGVFGLKSGDLFLISSIFCLQNSYLIILLLPAAGSEEEKKRQRKNDLFHVNSPG